jgi:RNA polymerase sigma-70 factor (ECF subfamily)
MNQPTPAIAFEVRPTPAGASNTDLVLRSLAPKLDRIVRAVLGASHPDVDDALQHALIGLARALPSYRGDCDLLGYARVIAVRAAVLTRKRARARQVLRQDEAEADDLTAAGPSPSERAASHRRMEVLRDLLAELPQEQAETLAMRVVLGCSLEEVAKTTGVPVNTVRSRVRLAKERLKARIESEPSLMDALDVG